VSESSYEYDLAKIEKAVDPILSKLISAKKIEFNKHRRKGSSCFFHYGAASAYKKRSGLLQIHFCDLADKLTPLFGKMPEFDHKELWFDILSSAPDFSKAIFNKIWFLGECDSKFYTSDHPVVLQNSTVNDPLRGTLGLDSYGIEIYMPLTDSLILCLFCEKLLNHYKGETAPLDFNDDQVLNVNWLQYIQSERFLFSSCNNFEMISKIR
jgi:hypothetical protein